MHSCSCVSQLEVESPKGKEKKREEDGESEQTAPASPTDQQRTRSPVVPGDLDDEALANAPLPPVEARPLSQKRTQGTQRPKKRSTAFDEKIQLTAYVVDLPFFSALG